jgi:hypothetical protein
MEGHLKRIDNEVTRNGFDLDIKAAHSHLTGHTSRFVLHSWIVGIIAYINNQS